MTEITAVLAVPASGTVHLPVPAAHADAVPRSPCQSIPVAGLATQPAEEAPQIMSVGILFGTADGSSPPSAAWGDCVGPTQPSSHTSPQEIVRNVVAPALVGRQLSSFRELVTALDELTHEVRVPVDPAEGQPGPEQPQGKSVRNFSRRDLLSVPIRLLRPEAVEERQRPPRTHYVTETCPLPPAVRYAVSQALLQAVASTRCLTMAQVISDEWVLPRPSARVPIQAACWPGRRQCMERMIATRADSLGYVLPDVMRDQMKAGEPVLVREIEWLVRRLKELGDPTYRPTLHVSVRGVLGSLYENNLGRVLGHLHRLHAASGPYPLRVEDPIIAENRSAQIDALRTLREYLRFREVDVTLVAHAWSQSLDGVQALVDAQAADAIRLDIGLLGGTHTAVDAFTACKSQGMGVILSAPHPGADLTVRAAAHVALATQPKALVIGPGELTSWLVSSVRQEMARTLALLRVHQGD